MGLWTARPSGGAMDTTELNALDVSVYRFFVGEPGRSVSHAAARLGASVGEVDKSARRLADFGLVEPLEDECYLAVNPMLAEVTELGAEELELSARRAAIETRRRAIRQVTTHWIDATRHSPARSAIDVVSGRAAMVNVSMHYAESCREELLSISPGRVPSRIDARTRLANLFSAERGVVRRCVYHHRALRDPVTQRYLRELADRGALVRLAVATPARAVVLDRKVALLPIVPTGAGPEQMAVVRDPVVLAWLVASFEQLWADASPLEDVPSGGQQETQLVQTRTAILRLLAEGEKDEAISRRLSISVRTCRRHIADYMEEVGASSRFQAGVIAAHSGYVASPLSDEE
jgi:DNA-binding CsgD family transcriptional regulator